MPKPQLSKTILVTGCSSGFGLLIAARLAGRGHTVYATMRDESKKTPLINEVNRRGGAVRVLTLDVTDQESIQSAMTTIAEEEGALDVLVNNAGFGIAGAFEDLSDADIREQMEVNFFGVQNMCRQAIPLMRQRRGSKIINISSVSGFSAAPCVGAYVASKWALEGFSESLFYELKLFGIHVALVQPGSYKTKIFYENRRYAKNFGNPQSPYFKLSQTLKKMVDHQIDQSKKDPEDVARLVEKIVRSSRPAFRYIPDAESRLMATCRKILPFRLYSALVERVTIKPVMDV